MSLKLDSLLNPAPAADVESQSSHPQPTRSDHTHGSTHEAAEVLATLSQFGRRESSHGQYSEERSPTSTFPQHRHGSFSSGVAPIEPAPAEQHRQSISPTLEQYHHGSKSPEERRASFATSPGPVLAPIQSLTSLIEEATHNAQVEQRSDAAPNQMRQPSPLVANIKTEPSTTSGDNTPFSATARLNDNDSLRTATDLQNEHGLRAPVPPSNDDMKPTPAPASKKRAAPKKGRAIKPSKKRKLEVDAMSADGDGRGSDTLRVRGGGSSKTTKKSQSGTPVTGTSPAPPSHAASSDVDGSDSEEDDNVYCICKGKDDHTWMIGCEACDDWFHGRCVGLQKENHERVLAKFICPLCEDAGKGHTTWKPMCRRDGCMEAAKVLHRMENIDGKRVETTERSKYCSDACGLAFFSNIVSAIAQKPTTPKKRKASSKKSNPLGAESDEDIDPPPRGGVLRPQDLKALVTATPTVKDFHALGSGVLSPPTTASPTSPTGATSVQLLPSESKRLGEIATEKKNIARHRDLLRDREAFVNMVRERARQYAEDKGVKPASVCGFDRRLIWNDAEFDVWRNSGYGRACIIEKTFEPDDEALKAAAAASGTGDAKPLTNGHVGTDIDGDTTMISPPGSSSDLAPSHADRTELTNPLPLDEWCNEKKCPHRSWQKLHLQEIRFENVEILNTLMKLEGEEKEVRDRAMIRWRREKVESGMAEGEEAGRAEGWVETVES